MQLLQNYSHSTWWRTFKYSSRKIKENGEEATGVVADVTSDTDRKNVFQTIFDTYGDLDILVNNAGMSDLETVQSTTDEHWDTTMDTNLNSVFKYSRQVLDHMVEKDKGVIINVTSDNGIRPLIGSAYSISKTVANALTQVIALQTKNTNVRCNAVCPGSTNTLMLQTSSRNKELTVAIPEISLDILRDKVDGNVPQTQPIDQANAALFLASDLSKAITGQLLQVDYGSYL